MLNKKVKCEFCGTDLIKPGCYVPKCYIARGKSVRGLTVALSSSEEPTLYDAIDCPRCGKQKILGVRERSCDLDRKITPNEMRESMGLKPIRSDNDTLEEGEWLWLGGDDLIRNHKWSCSKCGRGVKEQENYCPNCGLKMKKEVTND